ncbi:MAG: LysR substrate-binding domain-containing protein, partial [Dongiaceae bacterium]
FRAQHPRFEMRFLTGRNDYLFDSLEANEVDIILGKCHTGRKKGELLWREPLIWIGQPWALGKAHESVPLVAYQRPSETRDVIEAALLAARRPWIVVAQCANLLGILAAAEAGLGVTALGRNFVSPRYAEIALDVDLPPLGTLDYVLDRRADASDPAIDAFAEVLRSVAKQLVVDQTRGPSSE